MADVKRFLLLLMLLIAADFALTLLAVGYMGVNEPNPLYGLCGGLGGFLLVKGVASVICMSGLCWLGRQMPRAIKITVGVLCVLYGIAVFGGAAGLVWMTL